MNREAWLTGVMKGLRPWFRRAGYVIPAETKLSVGWPSSGGMARQEKDRVVAECWVEDGVPQIFISPTEAKSTEVAGHVAHELIHACIQDMGSRHSGQFREAMKKLGLVGKPVAAKPGKELSIVIAQIIERLGPYPHTAIRP